MTLTPPANYNYNPDDQDEKPDDYGPLDLPKTPFLDTAIKWIMVLIIGFFSGVIVSQRMTKTPISIVHQSMVLQSENLTRFKEMAATVAAAYKASVLHREFTNDENERYVFWVEALAHACPASDASLRMQVEKILYLSMASELVAVEPKGGKP